MSRMSELHEQIIARIDSYDHEELLAAFAMLLKLQRRMTPEFNARIATRIAFLRQEAGAP